MLHRVHYREGDLSPWCAARRETPRSSTLLAFFGGASGLMDVADTTTWQTSCACDKKSLICVKASHSKTPCYRAQRGIKVSCQRRPDPNNHHPGWMGGGMLDVLIYVGDGEAIMKGGRPNLDYVQYSTRFGPCAL